MNTIVEHINSAGFSFVEFAVPMFVQSGILIVILLLADLLLRKKVKAVFRYWIWMLVLVKLVLPTSLSSPLSLGYLFGEKLTYQDLTETTSSLELADPVPTDNPSGISPIYIQPNVYTPPTMPTPSVVEPATAGPVVPPAPVTPLSWQGVVFLVWLAVVIAMGLLLLQRALFVRGLVAQAKDAPRLMSDALEYCRENMKIKHKVGLKISPNATTPSVCGLIRPVILVPWNLASTLGASRLRTVLMHELAHIRRADLWVNLAQTILQIMYFYNPLLWFANCMIRRIREQAVDEAVLVAMGGKAQQYPQTLVDIAKMAFKRSALSLRLIGVVESESALAGRIKHILGRPMPRSAKLGIVGMLAVIIAGAILLPMARAQRQTEPEASVRDASLDHFVGKYALAEHPDTAVFEITKKGDEFIFRDLAGPKFEMDIVLRGLEGRRFEMEKGRDNLRFGDNPRERFRVRYNAAEDRYILDSLGMRGEVQDSIISPLTDLIKISTENSEDAFTVTLPHGGKLRLLALGRPTDTVGRCWEPDGTAIVGKPDWFADWERFRRNWSSSYLIAIVEAVHPGASPPSAAIGPSGEVWKIPLIVAKGIERPNGDKPSLVLGFGVGEWKTVGRLKVGESLKVGDFECEVEKVEAMLRKNPRVKQSLGTTLVQAWFTDLPDLEVALVAVGKSGKETTVGVTWGVREDIPVAGNKWQLKQPTLFDIDDLDHFVVRKRPRYWSTFTEFAIEPKKKLTKDSRFSATLPNGVTVELLGVSRHYIQSERPVEQTWWAPSGKILEKMPYAKLGWSATTDYRNSTYEFAVRLDGKEEYTYAAETSLGRSLGFPKVPKSKTDESLPNMRAFIGEFRKEDKEGNIRFGVAAGPWQEVEVWRDGWTGGEAYDVITHSKSSVVYEWPRQDGDKVVIEVTHTLANEDRRLIIVDTDGKIHIGDGRKFMGEGAGVVRDIYYFHNFNRRDMKVLKFEKRPYQWVGFNNVLLRPGIKTDVQVEVEKTAQSQFSTTLANGVRVEQPATIRVPEDYPTAYEAVKAAKDGDTLIISADRYLDKDILIEPKLVMLLDAINSCAAGMDLNIESISVSAKSMSIEGDTSRRTDTLKFLDAIKDNGLQVSQLNLESRDNRDRFRITVEPKENWRQWWQQHKTALQLEGQRKAGSVVQGKVLGTRGEPVKGATVELQIFVGGDVDDMTNYHAQRIFTDANGLYIFEGLKAGLAHIGRSFTVADGSISGVPHGLMFEFEIEPGRSYDITLGGRGRPVVGRLVPASGNAGDIDWSRARAYFCLQAAPFSMGSWESNAKIVKAMTKAEGGDFYRKSPVKINPDGTFWIDNVRAGLYMLRVKISEEPKKEGFNLFRDVRIPLMPDGTIETPLNLGSLAVSHGYYKAPRHIDNHFLSPLTLDKDIPVILKAGNDEEPDVVSAGNIRFSKDGELLKAALDIEWKSLVYEGWRARLCLLSGNGSYLVWHDVFFETSKMIEKYPLLFKETLNFSLEPQLDFSQIPRFTITIQPVSEILTGNEQPGSSAEIEILPAEVHPDVPVEGEGSETDAHTRVEDRPELVSAGIAFHTLNIDGSKVITPAAHTLEIKDGADVKKLASFFPKMEEKRISGSLPWWNPAATIIFYRSDDTAVVVNVSSDMRNWVSDVSQGDWPVNGDLREFLSELKNKAHATGQPGLKTVLPVEGEPGDESTESKTTEPKAQGPVKQRGGISGVVVNSVTGRPIAGAYVGVGDFGDSGGSNYSRHREQGFYDKTKTDAEGRFELGGLVFTDKNHEIEYHPLVVTHPDFVRHDEKIELLSSGPIPDVKVSLRPAAKIEVAIVDTDGNPIQGQWLLRLEALDGRRFIPPGSDPHLSSFASNVWAHWPDLRANMGFSNGFTFTELDSGRYLIEAIRVRLVDKPTPGNIWKPTITYHGSIPSLEIEAGQSKQVRLTLQDNQTRLTITPPDFPGKLMGRLERSSQMPLMCLISRSPGALLWDDGRIRHLEDQRLGRIDKKRFFRGFFIEGQPLVINNLPPDSYSLFTMAVYGQVAGYLIGARADLAKGDNITLDIPWRQPTGPSMFGPNRSFDYPVKLEVRDYSVSQLCEILTDMTQSNPRIIADPSIENEKLSFGKSQMSVWDVLEKLYLDNGWTLDESEGKTLIIRPADQINLPVEVEMSGRPEEGPSSVPDYSDLREAIKTAYNTRSELLLNSAGTANIVFETKEYNITNFEPSGSTADSATWTTKWYKRGDKNRYDIYVPPDSHRRLPKPQDIRTAQDPNKRIYYDAIQGKAYIDKPNFKSVNPFGLSNNFDITWLYQFTGKDVPYLLAVMEEAGHLPKITEDRIGPIQTVKLDYDCEYVSELGNRRYKGIQLWFAPEMAYSLIRAEFFSQHGEKLDLVDGYNAAYEESDQFEGVWLLKEVTIIDNQSSNISSNSERLTATFHNTKVGLDIPDEIFTFEGLGMPPGTKIYDKRFLVWGQSANGLRAALEFVPEKKAYSIGEQIGVRLHVHNTTGEPIQFISETWHQDDKATVEDEQGNLQPVATTWYSGRPHIERYYLKPGEKALLERSSFGLAAEIPYKQAKALDHPVGCTLVCKPGVYYVSFSVRLPDVKSSSLPPQADDWEGVLQTGKHKLVINDLSGLDQMSTVPVEIEGAEAVSGKSEVGPVPFVNTVQNKVTLTNGVTVELLGVCEHPSVGKQWWRPDGSLLGEAPYDDDFGRAFPQDGETGYKFAVKYSGLAGKEVDTRVIPTDFKTTNGGALFSTSKKNGKENTKYVEGSLDEKIVWLGAAFDEKLDHCDIRIGVCWGYWKSGYRYKTDQPNDIVEWVEFKNVSLRPWVKIGTPVEGDEKVKMEDLVWGKEVNGLRAALQFLPEKKSYSLGGRVVVRFHIQNVSEHDIQIASTSWRQDQRVFVQNDEGKEISVSSILFSGLPHIVRYILKPREICVLDSSGLGFGDAALRMDINAQPLTGNFILCCPGEYFVHYELKFPDIILKDGDGKVRTPQPDDWEGVLQTGKHKLVINDPSGPDQMSTLPVEGEGTAEAEVELLRETGARRAIAERRKERIEFLGLDLTDAPRTKGSADLPELFEARPPGSKSYHIRDDVTAVYNGLDGTVYDVPDKEIFYVQHDKLGASTLTYYGPFNGDPYKVLNLQTYPNYFYSDLLVVKSRPTIFPAMDSTTLQYKVNMDGVPAAAKRDYAERIIDILKKLIDRENEFKLVWKAVGDDKIEVTIPKDSEQQMKSIWGKPVDGIAYAVKPIKEVFLVGELLEFDVIYKNISRQPITVCVYPDPFYVWTKLRVLDSSGMWAASGQHLNGFQPPINNSHFVALRPGETVSVRQNISFSEISPLKPGRYIVFASVNKINPMWEHIVGYDEFCKENSLTPWAAVVETGRSSFKIVSDTDNQQSKMVEAVPVEGEGTGAGSII